MTLERCQTARMRLIAGLLALTLLAGCSANTAREKVPTPTATLTTSAQIPESCDATAVLPAIQKVLDNAELIDTQWEPAPGTELADVINGGGLACTYGHPRAELGATVMWLDDAASVIAQRRAEWETQGTAVQIDGTNEAWFIDPSKSNAEMPSWVVNAIVGDIWIQVRSNIGQTFEQSRDLVLSAVASLRS